MDPLSVAASIAGLLSAAGAVTKALAPYIAAARETPKIAVQVNSEIQSITIILSALQGLAQNLGSVPVQRAALIQVDHVVAVLTDGVLIFSDLEDAVRSLNSSFGDFSVSITRLGLRARLQWARKESEIALLLARLQAFKSSASLILDIFQSDSAMRAEGSRYDLANNVNQLLESSRDVAQRLRSLEDSFDARSMVSRRRSLTVSLKLGHGEDSETKRFLNRLTMIEDDSASRAPASPSSLITSSAYTATSAFDFEPDLEASRVYRRAQRETMDFSFRSSVAWSNGMSVFTGLTLGDVSILSVIALPICAAEISNAHHYTFGNREPLPKPIVAKRLEEQPVDTALKSLVYECLEVAIQLSSITGFADLFTGLDSSTEHPFDVLRRVFARGYPFLMLLDTPDAHRDANKWATSAPTTDTALAVAIRPFANSILSSTGDSFDFRVMLKSGDAGFLTTLDVIKGVLAERSAISLTVETFLKKMGVPTLSDRVEALLKKKRGYAGTTPPSDIVVEDFLAQERLFFHQLEDLPIVEKQMRILNLMVEERLSAIFTPLHEFMNIQLRFLLNIEQNLLQPPESQRWSPAFRAWSRNTELYGNLISTEIRTKAILRARLGSKEDPGRNFSPQVDTITACFKLVSLPALTMLGHLEFLDNLELQIKGSDDARLSDIAESRRILIKAHDEVSKIVKRADLSSEVLRLKQGVVDWKRLNINQFGELLMYDAKVKVLEISKPQRTYVYAEYQMFTFEKILIFANHVSDISDARRGTPRPRLEIKGRILLSNIKSIIHSEQRVLSTLASPCSCLIVHKVGFELEALEICFSSPPRRQLWSEELRATIQSPRAEEHHSPESSDISKMPVSYPTAWRSMLRNRGYLE